MKPQAKYFLIAAIIIIVDQVVKLLVKLNMRVDETIYVIGDFFKIHFVENPGAAFGMTLSAQLGNMSETTGKLILTIFSVVAVLAIVVVLYKISTHKTKLPLFVAFILGGAAGNIIDRVFYGTWFEHINDYEGGLFFGRVVDMFYIDIWHGQVPDSMPLIGGNYYFLWPIFNIADIAITVGIVVILIFQKRFFAPTTPPAAEVTPTTT